MKNTLKTFIIFGIALMIFSCNKLPSNKSSLTGFIFNDKKYGNFVKGNIQNYQKPPLGMVLIEGGSFTMGRVQDDVMFDWNTTPKKKSG